MSQALSCTSQEAMSRKIRQLAPYLPGKNGLITASNANHELERQRIAQAVLRHPALRNPKKVNLNFTI